MMNRCLTDVTKVVKTLNSLCKEMDERYSLLKVAGVRKDEEYNEKFKNRLLNPEHGHRYAVYCRYHRRVRRFDYDGRQRDRNADHVLPSWPVP